MRWYRINALLLKYFYLSVNKFDRIFDIIYWPVLDIFIWGFMTNYIKQVSSLNIMSMILGGIVLWVFVWRSSQDITVYILEDFWSKNLYNLYSSPMMIKELIISLLMLGVIRAVLAFTFLTIIAFLLFKFTVFEIGILYLGLFVLGLIIFSWSIGLFVSSFIMRWGSRIQVLAWSVVWIIQPFSCVFYPLSALPPWAQNVAKIFPTTYIFEGMRAAVNNQPINLSSIMLAIGLSLLFFIILVYIFYRSILRAKKTGLLAKND